MTDKKDAALRLALDALEQAMDYTNSATWSPSMTRDCEKAAAAIRAALAEPQGREWWAAVIESARHGPYLADTLHTSRDAALTSGGGMHRVIDAVRLA